MTTSSPVDEFRRRAGRVGAGLIAPPSPLAQWREAAAEIERLGYGSAWTNEGIGGKEILAHVGVLLGATDRLVFGSGVANIWARHPGAMQGGGATLADAFPGRFALGLGVSHPLLVARSGQEWTPPLPTLRRYLDAMDATEGAPTPEVPFPRIIGALGPKMVGLARDRADGAHPHSMPPAHTRAVRATLGPDKLLIVGVGFLVDSDRDRARDTVLRSGVGSLPDSPYDRELARLGLADPSDAGAVFDARFAFGGPEEIAARVADHLDAGADHVYLGPFAGSLDEAAEQLALVAPAVLKLA
jgi:probable F420-dependent oxidoreductase